MSDSDALSKAQQTMRRFQHEVRTPLGQIIGYSELLEEELEDRDQQDLAPDLQRIRSAAQRLLDLVDGKLRSEQDAGAPVLPEEENTGAAAAEAGDATGEPGETEPQETGEETERILAGIGEWLGANGNAIYCTRPWTRQAHTSRPALSCRGGGENRVLNLK